MINKIWQNKNMKESFLGSLHGLRIALATERNAKLIFFFGIIVISLGIILKVSLFEFMIIVLVTSSVLICEVFNTLVENILDMIQPETDPKIKILKDISSAAVLLSSLAAAVIGCIIFLPKITAIFKCPFS